MLNRQSRVFKTLSADYADSLECGDLSPLLVESPKLEHLYYNHLTIPGTVLAATFKHRHTCGIAEFREYYYA